MVCLAVENVSKKDRLKKNQFFWIFRFIALENKRVFQLKCNRNGKKYELVRKLNTNPR